MTTTQTATGRDEATRRAPAPRGARGRLMIALLVVAVGLLGSVAAGWWGLRADRAEEGDGATRAGWVSVGDAWLRVSQTTDMSVDHSQGMPNMQTMPDADPVPEGLVRYGVELQLAADDSDLTWQASDFTVKGDDGSVTPPHRVELGDGVVPAGSTVSGSLVFDVPEDASSLSLQFRDGPLVPLDLPQHHTGSSDEPTHSHDE